MISVSVLSSCKTSKDLTFLNNSVHEEFLKGVPIEPIDYLINTNDNLYVQIQSKTLEADAMFNPSKSGNRANNQQGLSDPLLQNLNGFQVDLSGNINLPSIGKVQVVGKTIDEARIAIQNKADKYFKNATVKVHLLNFKITILGEVKKTGVYYNYAKNMTIFDGIGMAGGPTEFSKIKQVLILRTSKKGTKTYRLDLTDKKILNSEVFYLQPNDVIFVDPDRYKSLQFNVPLISLILSTITTSLLVVNILTR